LRLAALLCALIATAVAAAPAHADFGIADADVSFTDALGLPAAQAGSHPASWTSTFAVNTTTGGQPDGQLKDLRIVLPAGLIGTLAAAPRCSRVDFDANSCPANTAAGTIAIDSSRVGLITIPLYNLNPSPGAVATLAFSAQGVPAELGMPILVNLSLDRDPPHEVIATIPNIAEGAGLLDASITISPSAAGLLLPRSCTGPLPVTYEADSWQQPGRWVSRTVLTHDNASAPNPTGLSGCDLLSFSPQLSMQTTGSEVASASGLALAYDTPALGFDNPAGLAEADLSSLELTLPEGFGINASVASSLALCTPAELAEEGPEYEPGHGCPSASRLGDAEARSPIFGEPLSGDAFAADGNSPFRFYVVLRNPDRGLVATATANVDPDPRSGRLAISIADLPQIPLSHFHLHLWAGPRAPLRLPPDCSASTASATFTSSAGAVIRRAIPLAAPARCPAPSFAPALSAGTVDSLAGHSSTFVFDLALGESDEDLSRLSVRLPPGLAADFNAASICPEADAAAAACAATSRLGYARIAVGAGTDPLWVPGGAEPDSAVYLAGPYRDAPYSLLVSVPAVAGPFDLGKVVLRAPVRIDPDTAQASVELAELPQIIDGIPLHYRAIRLVLDRPGLIRNPTSCEPSRVELFATASTGVTATASDRFQAADCAALGFRPRLSLRLSGGLGRGGHPGIEATLRPRAADASLAAASFALPAGELLDTRRIGALCERDLPAAGCPDASRLGRAVIRSPLLPEPLRGPVFLRAPSGRYPDLLASLGAGELRILLHGRIASAAGGRLVARFTGLPDIPVSRASFMLAGGRRGIVVNSEGLCSRRPRAVVLLDAQNGRERSLRPLVRLGGACQT
jgi:hypothetical protein